MFLIQLFRFFIWKILWNIGYERDSTVARDFLSLVFSHESTTYSPQIHTLEYFLILFRICRNIRN
jgi:hypothetical protein